MSNLRDRIRFEIERRRLSEPFTVKQLKHLAESNGGRIGGNNVNLKHINSVLANQSIGPGPRRGESVKRGQKALFQCHGRGTYSLIYDDYEAEIEVSETPPAVQAGDRRGRATPPRELTPLKPRLIAQRFVEYLREMPYRLMETALPGHALRWPGRLALGWIQRLNAYEWGGHDWAATEIIIGDFIRDLRALRGTRSPGDAGSIYERIRLWGNPRGIKRSGAETLVFLEPLWRNGTILDVDSTLTKLYAFADPDNYVIYDSRVAAAMLTIAEDIFRIKNIDDAIVDFVKLFHDQFEHLGLYNASAGTRPRGYRWPDWENAYGIVEAQYDANTLCKLIVDVLNEPKSPESKEPAWTLREVEAVLFMAGY